MDMPVTDSKRCEFCDKEISNDARFTKRVRFCSVKCSAGSRSKKIDRTCVGCSSVFSVKQSIAERGEGLFCTRKCYVANKDTSIAPISMPSDMRAKTCRCCGCEYKIPAKYADLLWSDFCTEECMHKSAHDAAQSN